MKEIWGKCCVCQNLSLFLHHVKQLNILNHMIRTFNNLIVSSRENFFGLFQRILMDNGCEIELSNGKSYQTIIDDEIVEVTPIKVDMEGNNIYVTYIANGETDVDELSLLSLDEVIKVGEILMDEF